MGHFSLELELSLLAWCWLLRVLKAVGGEPDDRRQ